jgi:hypothetical protein
MSQYNGWLELFYGVATFVLGAVLAWAVLRNKYRNRANDAVTDAATRAQYEHPESYNPEQFRRELGPKT